MGSKTEEAEEEARDRTRNRKLKKDTIAVLFFFDYLKRYFYKIKHSHL